MPAAVSESFDKIRIVMTDFLPNLHAQGVRCEEGTE